MRKFKAGDKVIPIGKSTWGSFENWKSDTSSIYRFFERNGYLFVSGYDKEEKAYMCYHVPDSDTGDFFRESDLVPYEEKGKKVMKYQDILVDSMGRKEILQVLFDEARKAGYRVKDTSKFGIRAIEYPIFWWATNGDARFTNRTNFTETKQMISVKEAIEFFRNNPYKPPFTIQGHEVIRHDEYVDIGCQKNIPIDFILNICKEIENLSVKLKTGTFLYKEYEITLEEIKRLKTFVS